MIEPHRGSKQASSRNSEDGRRRLNSGFRREDRKKLILAGQNGLAIAVTPIPRRLEHPFAVAAYCFRTNHLCEKLSLRPPPYLFTRRRFTDHKIETLTRVELER